MSNLGALSHICRRRYLFGQFQSVPACDIRAHWISLEEALGHVSVIFPNLVCAKFEWELRRIGAHLVNPQFAPTFKVEYRADLSSFKKVEF